MTNAATSSARAVSTALRVQRRAPRVPALLFAPAAGSASSSSPLQGLARLQMATAAPRPRSAAFSTAARDAAQSQDQGGNSTSADDQNRKQSRRGMILLSSALLSTGLIAGIGLTWFTPRPRIVSLVFPIPTGHPPPEDTPEHRAHTREIEREMLQLDLVKRLEAETIPAPAPTVTNPSDSASSEAAPLAAAPATTDAPAVVKKYTVSRPYAATRAGPHSLSAYTLRGPGKFAVPPLVFTTHDKRESVLVLHVGDGLCGHEGVVHGGLLATVLDEALGRTVRSSRSPVSFPAVCGIPPPSEAELIAPPCRPC